MGTWADEMRAEIERRGMTRRDFAAAAGVAESNLSTTLSRGNPTVSTLERYAAAIDCDVVIWFVPKRNRTENQTRSSRPVKTAPDSSTILEAGDRARTDDIQLGNVTAKGKS